MLVYAPGFLTETHSKHIADDVWPLYDWAPQFSFAASVMECACCSGFSSKLDVTEASVDSHGPRHLQCSQEYGNLVYDSRCETHWGILPICAVQHSRVACPDFRCPGSKLWNARKLRREFVFDTVIF
jgi:hypothetical protein